MKLVLREEGRVGREGLEGNLRAKVDFCTIGRFSRQPLISRVAVEVERERAYPDFAPLISFLIETGFISLSLHHLAASFMRSSTQAASNTASLTARIC